MCIILDAAGDNGCRFGHHCRRRMRPNSIKQDMWKAAHPMGGMDSTNSRRRRGKRLQHHGGVVCHLVCVLVWSRLVFVTHRM